MSKVFIPPKIKIQQSIREILIGQKALNQTAVGNQSAMPFVGTDGHISHRVKLAVEIHDCVPENYPETLISSWEGFIDDPVKWAGQAKTIGADLIALRITGLKEQQKSPEELVHLAKRIIESTQLPLCVLGLNNREIDKKALPIIAEGLKGYNCLIGPVEEETYRDIIPACRDNGHCIIARTPIDINLAKQLNILITEMGFDPDKIVIDPNMGGLGYGLDYAYSIIEKIRVAAFEGDNSLNMPIIVLSGEEAWRTKEAKAKINDDIWGEAETRTIMWELLTTSAMIMAGADITVMRYPPSIKYIAAFLRGK